MQTVHLIWMQGWEWAPKRILDRVQKNTPLWKRAGLQVQLWDEKRILTLLDSNRQLKGWFLSLQTTIAKCDIGRAIILQHNGGLYADADFDPNPSGIQELVKECITKKCVLFPADSSMGKVNNYIIASVPHAPFWQTYFEAAGKAISNPEWKDVVYALLRPTWPVLSSHGPVLISRLLQEKVAEVSTVLPLQLGLHGWLEGEQDSAWYRTKPERLQRHVALVTLCLAAFGVLTLLYWVLKQTLE